MCNYRLMIVLSAFFLATTIPLNADSPVTLSIQGRLSDRSNTPITTSKDVEVRVYRGGSAASVDSGTPVYKEQTNITPAAGGVFEYRIGTGAPIEGHTLTLSDLQTTEPLYVLLIVDGFPLLPKVELAKVHQAYVSDSVVDGGIKNVAIAADAAIDHSKIAFDSTKTLNSVDEKNKFNELIGGGVTTLHKHPLHAASHQKGGSDQITGPLQVSSLETNDLKVNGVGLFPFGGAYTTGNRIPVPPSTVCGPDHSNPYTGGRSCPSGFTGITVAQFTCGYTVGHVQQSVTSSSIICVKQ
jgi:hypothetical protein